MYFILKLTFGELKVSFCIYGRVNLNKTHTH